MSNKIIVINAGSSSIKFKIYENDADIVIASGLCERIFVDGHFTMTFGEKKVDLDVAMPNHTKATECVLEQLKSNKIITDLNEIVGVGHRVVLSGENIKESLETTDWVKKEIKEHIKLAPLHNDPELVVINIFQKLLPHATSVASFDNTFHATIPEHNYTYAIEKNVAKKYAIRRYGFHGNSYRYITKQMCAILKKPKVNLIVAHLGNGASITAIKNNISYATSMGLTPLEGLIMGSRCGDIDPSVPLYLLRQGLSVDEIDNLLNKKSGVLGLSTMSDMRDIQKKVNEGGKDAILALKMYAQRVARYIVDYLNQLDGKIDGLVFTAGVGENSVFTIEHIINEVKIVRLELDNTKLNDSYKDYKLISKITSTYPIYCVRTDEELMIVHDVREIIQKKGK